MATQQVAHIHDRPRYGSRRFATSAMQTAGEFFTDGKSECIRCVNRLNGSCNGQLVDGIPSGSRAELERSVDMDSIARRSIEGFRPGAPRPGGGRIY